MPCHPPDFAPAIVRWQRKHGRHTLPWQNTRDPYRVWLSEIMLQQTQVRTVIGYFERFLQRCPSVADLAAASNDEVMGLWSGLGYYSRARNLHRCAQLVVQQHGGAFPRDAATLATLPGIGRSTAAAIASLCFGQREAILDANVRRVLTRVLGFDADLSRAANERALWAHAQALLPDGPQASTDMPHYTQGMMDLGASLCSPTKPDCPQCPVGSMCCAARDGDPQRYPVRSRTVRRSSQHLWLLWLQDDTGAVWLSKRPSPGVWAQLQCFPVFDSEAALLATPGLGAHCSALEHLPTLTHALTHKELFIHPVRMNTARAAINLIANQLPSGAWFRPGEWASAGLPAPVRKLLLA